MKNRGFGIVLACFGMDRQDSAGKAILGFLRWAERVLNCPFSIPKRLERGVSAMQGLVRET